VDYLKVLSKHSLGVTEEDRDVTSTKPVFVCRQSNLGEAGFLEVYVVCKNYLL
jgi:hypothetical protein